MLNLKLDWKGILVVGAGLVIIGYYAKNKVKEVAAKVNPVDDKNVINQGFESLWQKMTGSNQSPGADLYDWLHGTSENDF